MNDSEKEDRPGLQELIPPHLVELFEKMDEPKEEDPSRWAPSEVLALYLRYAYAVSALPHLGDPEWEEAREVIEDLLFSRDLLQEWIDRFGEEGLMRIGKEFSVPLQPLEELDEELLHHYLTSQAGKEFIDEEYELFREDLSPPEEAMWWWLDRLARQRRMN
jgi:hypothetical protein